MITIAETSTTDMTILADTNTTNTTNELAPMDRPRQFRRRTSSESIPADENELLLPRNPVHRSASCSEVYAQRRELHRLAQGDEISRYRVRLRCRDEDLCVRSQENVLRLVETVQKKTSSSTSVILAQKALKYRRLLDRAERVDLSDPTFDITQFMSEKRGRTEVVGFCAAP